MSTKRQYRDAEVGMSYATVKKCVFSLVRKLDNELALRMSLGSEH